MQTATAPVLSWKVTSLPTMLLLTDPLEVMNSNCTSYF